jgi:hypothetical protein
MASGDESHRRSWSGEEVTDAPPGEAEAGADAAEGNRKVTAGQQADRREGAGTQPEDQRVRRPSGLTPEEKIAEAAEEHRRRAAEVGRLPHGKL